MIRNSQKVSTLPIVPGISLDLNPLSSEAMSARRMENWIPDRGRLVRVPPAPLLSNSTIDPDDVGVVTKIHNFRYYRNSAPENKVVYFGSNGKGKVLKNGTSQPIFPGTASFETLKISRPYVGQIGNRLFFSDGQDSYVYDGRDPCQAWGLSRSTTAPSVSAVAAGSLTAATGLKACITWVVKDEQGNRVHESSRSDVSAFQILAAENLRVDIGALSAPARATHWDVYLSELNGSNIYRRHSASIAIGTTTVDISALPAATSPKAPIRNDPPPPSSVGCVAKNRHFLRDDANPNRFYFSALGEVEGLLNGSGAESFPGYGTNSVSDLSNSDTVPDREIRCIVEHENEIILFTESRAYALVGELNLLDSRSPRSLVKLQKFNEGCLGPDAAVSTPYGLVWMSPNRKIWLWTGTEILDIGLPVQQHSDALATTKTGTLDAMYGAHMRWWSGKGRQWLVLTHITTSASQTIHYGAGAYRIFDFGVSTKGSPGIWFNMNPSGTRPQCTGVYQDDEGNTFLLGGGSSFIHVLDHFDTPAHFDLSFTLGSSYLIDNALVVPTMPDSYLYTNLMSPNGDEWVVGNYVSLVHGVHNSAAALIYAAATDPTVSFSVDAESVDSLGNSPGISLTLNTETTANEMRAWLKPESSGNTNVGGAYGKHFAFFIKYASVSDYETITDLPLGGGVRALPIYNTINRMAASWTGKKDL